MSKKTVYKGSSKRARELLASGETQDVDYKIQPKGLHADDLVAFANSERGGAILIGVEESARADGSQIGKPCGCVIGDGSKLQIMGKALSCSPPVQIELFVENAAKAPFYRIEIPSGSAKPHSTGSGTYKIREDGRNQALLPDRLLQMFLEREGEEFRKRFGEATAELEKSMEHAVSTVDTLEGAITAKIQEISSDLGMAEYEASSARSTIEDVESAATAILNIAREDRRRLRALLQHLEANDPVVEEAKAEVREYLADALSSDAELMKKVKERGSVSLSGGSVGELNKEQLSKILMDVIREIEKENSQT